MEQKKIILIGAGNVAHHLATTWLKKGLNVCQIYSRTLDSAGELGIKTGIAYTNDINQIYPDGDVYVFCVSDDALQSVLKNIRLKGNPFLIHTSGTLPMTVLRSFSANFGVLYPLQTFSKNRDLDFSEIPVFLEGSNPLVEKLLTEIASPLSIHLHYIDSGQRQLLHLAAVFACNFPNYLYRIAGDLLEKNGMDFSWIRPLIFETAHKVMTMRPEEAQTGPAKRGDETILSRHKNRLKHDSELLQLYTLLSQMIQDEYRVDEPEIEEEAQKPKEIEMPTLW